MSDTEFTMANLVAAAHRAYALLPQKLRDREPSQWEVEAVTARGTVTVQVLRESHFGSCSTVPEKLSEAIAWLRDHLRSIPMACRDSAKLEIESVGGYEGDHHAEVSISFARPETDDEWAARRADVERRIALWRAKRERDERKEFARLKAKFG